MTNLTGRIRYYSFYCWLLDEYDKHGWDKEKKSIHAQYNFIRRAELIMAFLMVVKEPNGTNVPGSNYATRHKSDRIYSLIQGADKPGKELYWDYGSGALGQYYAGSLINLGLIEVAEKYFHIKPKGQKIADAFRSVVSENERDYYLELIRIGSCSWDDFDKIISFRLNSLNASGEEWKLLRNLLLEADGDSFKTRDGKSSEKRLESITLFLQSKEAGISLGEFPLWIFNNITLDVDNNSSRFGWFCYYLNEAVHYSLLTIFWAFLFNAEGQILEFDSYLQDFESKVLYESIHDLGINELGTLQDILYLTEDGDIPAELSKIKDAVRQRNSYYAAGKSALLLTIIYNFVNSYKDKITGFERNNYIDYQKGHLSQNLSIYIGKNINASVSDYIDRIVKTLLNDHMSTAYRKMGNRDANLLKFLKEERCLIHIETIEPQGTNPRTQSLRNFMQDLGYIDSEENLTTLGKELLNELKK